MQSNYRENGMGCDALEWTAVRMISKSKVLQVQYREPEGRLKDVELRGMWNGFGFDSKDGRERYTVLDMWLRLPPLYVVNVMVS